MKLKNSNYYESLALQWQYYFICYLRNTLKKHGVKDKVAKDIVGEFTFDFAMLHDQGEIEVNGKTYVPRVAFVDQAGTLICSSEESNLHEYALGSTSQAYGD